MATLIGSLCNEFLRENGVPTFEGRVERTRRCGNDEEKRYVSILLGTILAANTRMRYVGMQTMRYPSTQSIGPLVCHLRTMRPDCKPLFVAFCPYDPEIAQQFQVCPQR
jgi:hypothetical protein